MPPYLIFLFLLQSGLALGFSWFMARLIMGGADAEGLERSLQAIRRLRTIVLAVALCLPPLMFLAFYKSLPEESETAVAVWPAVWIFMILAGVVLGLTFAIRRKPGQHGGS